MTSRVLRVAGDVLSRLVAYAIALVVLGVLGALVGGAIAEVRGEGGELSGLAHVIFGGYAGLALGAVVLVVIEVMVARDERRRVGGRR
jgi:hypothetical protein